MSRAEAIRRGLSRQLHPVAFSCDSVTATAQRFLPDFQAGVTNVD